MLGDLFSADLAWAMIFHTSSNFPGGSVVKNLPANAGDAGDLGLAPGSGRCPGGGDGNHASTLACRIPWTEEPAVYDHKEVDTTE